MIFLRVNDIQIELVFVFWGNCDMYNNCVIELDIGLGLYSALFFQMCILLDLLHNVSVLTLKI